MPIFQLDNKYMATDYGDFVASLLEKGINEGSYYRTLGKKYQCSYKEKSHNYRDKPEFFPYLHIIPEFFN
jgi:hypothetical protein